MQNYIAHFDGSVVILLFLIAAVGLGIWLFCINVFIPRERYEKGLISALKTWELHERGLKEVQTYEEAKQRGIRFAEQILRNYPETGLESLRHSVADRRSSSIPGDSCFADGIEEVLCNLANRGCQK